MHLLGVYMGQSNTLVPLIVDEISTEQDIILTGLSKRID